MNIPPLNPLRNFEAAARLGSFRRAAAELCVTEGAVSRQIRTLEDYLGLQLFHRRDRKVDLTEAGERLFEVSREMFVELSRTVYELTEQKQTLRLESTTSFAMGWLLERLQEFEIMAPDVRVSLQTGSGQAIGSIGAESFDVSIVYLFDRPSDDDPKLMKIVDEAMVPVCRPELLPEGRKMTLGELSRQRLLLNEYTGRDWRKWAKLIGIEDFSWDRSVRFDSDNAAIQAAVSGYGIALANLLYVERAFGMGLLRVAVDCQPLVIGAHYLYFHRVSDANLPRVMTFRRWIKAAASASYRSLAGAHL